MGPGAMREGAFCAGGESGEIVADLQVMGWDRVSVVDDGESNVSPVNATVLVGHGSWHLA